MATASATLDASPDRRHADSAPPALGSGPGLTASLRRGPAKPAGLSPSRVPATPSSEEASETATPGLGIVTGLGLAAASPCGCGGSAGAAPCGCRKKARGGSPQPPAPQPPGLLAGSPLTGSPLTGSAAATVERPGQPFPAPVRSKFQSAFGADLSGVQLHTDALAASASDQLDARAFTSGDHVAMGAGEWAPGTPAGDRLIAHELTHVLQNRRSGGAPAGDEADARAEQEADRAAEQVAAGGRPSPPAAGPSRLARAPKGQGKGVTKIEVNCATQQISFNGPRAHSYPLTECDLDAGDYDATVDQQVRTTTLKLMLQGAPKGTRFTFSYSFKAGDPDPMELVTMGQPVKVHAVAGPKKQGDGPAADQGGRGGGGDEGDVHLSVRKISPEYFTAMTGLPPSVLLEGQLVSASVLAGASGGPAATGGLGPSGAGSAGSGATGTPGLGTAGLGPAGVGAWYGTPTPMSLLPPNSTFLLWTEGHMSVGANVDGALTVRGYRGNLGWYTGEMVPGVGPWFTRKLLGGVPGGFENDWLFPKLSGFGSPQTVIYLPTTTEGAAAFAGEVNAFEAGGEYRYSPPRPPGTPGARPTETGTYERLYGNADPTAVRCTNNCITVPVKLAEKAIGTRPTTPVGDQTLDIASGRLEPSGRVDPFEAGRAGRMRDFMRAPEGLAPGAGRITMTPGAMRGMGFIRVGGTIALVYGVYHTASHLAATYGTPEFPAAVGEETGAWAAGLLGSALGSAAGAAIACAPLGPVDAACVVGGFLGGLVVGAVFGTAGGYAGHEIGAAIGNINSNTLSEGAVQMFGSAEDKRIYYDNQQFMKNAF